MDEELAPIALDQTILIVDDAPSNIKMLAAILNDLGSSIIFATKGSKALEMASERHPDIILLDVLMPEMDGHEVCRQLKANPKTKDIPVVFITALDDTNDEEEGLKLGAIDYIAKPFSPAIVKARVINHLALRHATRALQGANEELKRLATTDPLTNAFNRRHFMEMLSKESNRHARYHNDLCVLMLDIDHFKAVNDNYGHASGDNALKSVVTYLHDTLRETDILGRLGGEEFAVILPETNRDNAFLLADRLRIGISDLLIDKEGGGQFQITTSIGLYSEEPMKSETPEDMLNLADKALYSAKKTGRNKVVDYHSIDN